MKPFIKWAGGKRRFAPQIANCIGTIEGRYFEPFIGSGAVLLNLLPQEAFCADVNSELINLYNVIKEHPVGLIRELKRNFVSQHCHDFYYQIREWDRNLDEFHKHTAIQRAARFIYLNKTCYNGIWRVNAQGQNNVPMGRYKAPSILVEEEIIEASNYFQNKDIQFVNADYKSSVDDAREGDFVYFDPPYDVDEGQSSFLAYSKSLFNRDKQIELKQVCDSLINKGVRVGISNSDTKFIRQLYLEDGRYRLALEFSVNRTIGGPIESRRKFSELFIIGHL